MRSITSNLNGIDFKQHLATETKKKIFASNESKQNDCMSSIHRMNSVEIQRQSSDCHFSSSAHNGICEPGMCVCILRFVLLLQSTFESFARPPDFILSKHLYLPNDRHTHPNFDEDNAHLIYSNDSHTLFPRCSFLSLLLSLCPVQSLNLNTKRDGK